MTIELITPIAIEEGLSYSMTQEKTEEETVKIRSKPLPEIMVIGSQIINQLKNQRQA